MPEFAVFIKQYFYFACFLFQDVLNDKFVLEFDLLYLFNATEIISVRLKDLVIFKVMKQA